MIKYNLYLHGVPIGHDVWGPEEDQNYLNRFYKDNIEVKESAILRAEIHHGKTFYTYLRKNAVLNAEKRPGSFIGISLSFDGLYCNNVYLLYKIFDAIYKKICVGSIIGKEGKNEIFLIRKFSEADSILGKINVAFGQQLEKLLSNNFSALDSNFKQDGEENYNLLDIDSPSFVESFKAHVILISQEFPSKNDELSDVLQQIQPIRKQYEELKESAKSWEHQAKVLNTTNESLNKQISGLGEQIDTLKKELAIADKKASAKYELQIRNLEGQLKKMGQDLEKLSRENESYQEEIRRMQDAIKEGESEKELYDLFKQIKEPLNTFLRQTASRFQGGTSNYKRINFKDAENTSKKGIFKVRLSWINSILLVLVFAISVYFLVASCYGGNNGNGINEKEFNELKNAYYHLRDSVDSLPLSVENTVKVEDTQQENVMGQQSEHTINIAGYSGSGPLYINRTYTLNVKDYDGMCIWSAEGPATIAGNRLTVTGTGTVTISGRATGVSIKSRTLNADRATKTRAAQNNDSIQQK